jgi:hypothetical protein
MQEKEPLGKISNSIQTQKERLMSTFITWRSIIRQRLRKELFLSKRITNLFQTSLKNLRMRI